MEHIDVKVSYKSGLYVPLEFVLENGLYSMIRTHTVLVSRNKKLTWKKHVHKLAVGSARG